MELCKQRPSCLNKLRSWKAEFQLMNQPNQNRWLLDNIFDQAGNYSCCSRCVISVLGVGSARLARLRKLKKNFLAQPSFDLVPKSSLSQEELACVEVPSDVNLDRESWLKSLPPHTEVRVWRRAQWQLSHGLKGRASNNAKQQHTLEQFLSFFDSVSKIMVVRAGSGFRETSFESFLTKASSEATEGCEVHDGSSQFCDFSCPDAEDSDITASSSAYWFPPSNSLSTATDVNSVTAQRSVASLLDDQYSLPDREEDLLASEQLLALHIPITADGANGSQEEPGLCGVEMLDQGEEPHSVRMDTEETVYSCSGHHSNEGGDAVAESSIASSCSGLDILQLQRQHAQPLETAQNVLVPPPLPRLQQQEEAAQRHECYYIVSPAFNKISIPPPSVSHKLTETEKRRSLLYVFLSRQRESGGELICNSTAKAWLKRYRPNYLLYKQHVQRKKRKL